jgi:Ca2+-binding RTX toxin-like protein
VVVHLGAGDDQAVGDMGFGTYLGGAGDDRFWQHQLTDGDTSKLTYRGGPGRDVLTMNYRLLSDFVRPVTVRSADHLITWTAPGEDHDTYPNAVHYLDIEVLRGGDGNDRFFGSAGRQWFEGGGGRDRMWGGRGNDVLLGGAGRDQAWGGPGRDRCGAEHRTSCEVG